MTAPGQVDVWAGLDAGKGGHFADVLDNDILAMLRTGQPYQPARPAPGLPRAA